MARPIKQGLTYFPLDVDFLEDVKVLRITHGQGPGAVAVLIYLLGNIYKDHGYYMEWNEDVPFLVARATGTSEGTARAVIEKAVCVGFFDESMKTKYNILTSRGIQKRYRTVALSTKRSLQNVRDEYALIEFSSEKTRVSSEETPINSAVMRQRKEKERKEKESISPPSPPAQEPAPVSQRVEDEMYRLMGGVNLQQLDTVAEWVGKWGEEAVISAMQRAQVNGSRRLGYVQSILEGSANGQARKGQTQKPQDDASKWENVKGW